MQYGCLIINRRNNNIFITKITNFNIFLIIPTKKTLVMGASLNPKRYSNIAIHRLIKSGIQTEAYGLKLGTVSGVHIKNKFTHFHNINTITLYLNPKRQQAFYENFVDLRPKRVIFNPGTENQELYDLLKKEGIQVVVACTLVLLATGQY